MKEPLKILTIDDDVSIHDFIAAILRNEPYNLLFAANGLEGLLAAEKLLPDVILLDVLMPGMNGLDVCRAIRLIPLLNTVPILLITSLSDRDSRLDGLRAGADDFISKPFDRFELIVRLSWINRLNRYRRIAEQRLELEFVHQELVVSYDKTIEGWSNALDLRDQETQGHTERVTQKTAKMAQWAGITEEQLPHIWRGALLHDVGKLGIPDVILLKPEPLAEEDWVIMKTHPTMAHDWLSRIPFLQAALDIPYCHHEKWDGSGYPRGLKGAEIPLPARLFAIIDVWDTITSERPYRKALDPDEAYQFILANSGSHFDPAVVALFSEHIHEL